MTIKTTQINKDGVAARKLTFTEARASINQAALLRKSSNSKLPEARQSQVIPSTITANTVHHTALPIVMYTSTQGKPTEPPSR